MSFVYILGENGVPLSHLSIVNVYIIWIPCVAGFLMLLMLAVIAVKHFDLYKKQYCIYVSISTK